MDAKTTELKIIGAQNIYKTSKSHSLLILHPNASVLLLKYKDNELPLK